MVAVVLSFVFGCKKDPVNPPEESRKPAEVIDNLISSLETTETISVFVDALKGLSLSATEVEEGITVFAPLNDEDAQIQPQARMMGNKMSAQAFGADDLSPMVLKDHIVKGVLKLADLTNGRVLISLSGKELKISRIGDTIWINGVQIGSDEMGATVDQVVYTVKTLLSGTSVDDELQTTSLEVTVWDATAWAPGQPSGVEAMSGTVWLYASQQDYANGVAAYEATIDTGKALFEDIEPGLYGIVVESGDKGSIFYQTTEPQEGYYFGMVPAGIFQSQAEIDEWPVMQPDAAVGNFKWTDVNSDGVINGQDVVRLPYEQAEVKDGRVTSVEVLVGYGDNAAHKPLTPEEFGAQLNAVHNQIGAWQKELAIADALLSGEAVVDTIPALASRFGPLTNFSFTPAAPVINDLWQGGYSFIRSLNVIESRTPEATELGTLRVFRAYTYLQLMHYFGNIPLATMENQGTSLSNSDPDAVYDFIVAELERAAAQLPQRAAGGGVSKGAALALLAKAALFKGNYQAAADLTGQIIASGTYSLGISTAQIFQSGGSEIIWDHSEGMDASIKQFFFGRSVFPIIRYTEVLLMNAEALVAMGKEEEAGQICNQLAERRGLPPGGSATADQVWGLWGREMPKEGNQFVNMVRWGQAANALGWRGYTEGRNSVLPIPQSVMDANPNMRQNPGY